MVGLSNFFMSSPKRKQNRFETNWRFSVLVRLMHSKNWKRLSIVSQIHIFLNWVEHTLLWMNQSRVFAIWRTSFTIKNSTNSIIVVHPYSKRIWSVFIKRKERKEKRWERKPMTAPNGRPVKFRHSCDSSCDSIQFSVPLLRPTGSQQAGRQVGEASSQNLCPSLISSKPTAKPDRPTPNFQRIRRKVSK